MGNKIKVNNLNVTIIKLVVEVCGDPASNTQDEDKQHVGQVDCPNVKKARRLGLF